MFVQSYKKARGTRDNEREEFAYFLLILSEQLFFDSSGTPVLYGGLVASRMDEEAFTT